MNSYYLDKTNLLNNASLFDDQTMKNEFEQISSVDHQIAHLKEKSCQIVLRDTKCDGQLHFSNCCDHMIKSKKWIGVVKHYVQCCACKKV